MGWRTHRTSDDQPVDELRAWLPHALRQLEAYYWSPGGLAQKTKLEMANAGSSDWRAALVMFYRHYAYERAGAPRTWGDTAADIIERLSDAVELPLLAERAWLEFRAEVPKPNPRNNPLCSDRAREPVTRFVVSLDSDGGNLIAWAARLLRGGSGMEAYLTLQKHIGIGEKIAAFFLRDVCTSHGIREETGGDLRCILPIDVWVRRGVAVLAAQPELTDEARDSETERQALRLAREHGVGVATLDTGLWVLGARFARSPTKMETALRDPSYLRELVDKELRRVEGAIAPLHELSTSLRVDQVSRRQWTDHT
jgi:hypothetical protein